MQETNNYWFSRAVVPVDAIDCTKMRVWICYDAAKGGLMVDAWGGYLRKKGPTAAVTYLPEVCLLMKIHRSPNWNFIVYPLEQIFT